jgi:flagellar motility protein MotE (MotC chaperone)
LEKRLQELEQTRKVISQVLEEKVQTDDKKVETLVQMYSNMKPQQAAKVFETMDEDLAVEILGRMKKKNAAEIMKLIKAEKAQIFSEKYAGYKRK